MFITNDRPVLWEDLNYSQRMILGEKFKALKQYWRKKGYEYDFSWEDFKDLLEYHDILDIKANSQYGQKFRIVPIDPTKTITKDNIQIITKLTGFGRNFF